MRNLESEPDRFGFFIFLRFLQTPAATKRGPPKCNKWEGPTLFGPQSRRFCKKLSRSANGQVDYEPGDGGDREEEGENEAGLAATAHGLAENQDADAGA